MLQLLAGSVFVLAPPLRHRSGSPVLLLSAAGFVDVNAAPETPSAPATKNTSKAANAVRTVRPAILGRRPNLLLKCNALPPWAASTKLGGAHAGGAAECASNNKASNSYPKASMGRTAHKASSLLSASRPA